MGEDIIGMDDMMSVYEVTDGFGIDREMISVPLEKAEKGTVTRQIDGTLEITVPGSIPTQEWLTVLRAELVRLGYEWQDIDDDEL